MLKTNRLTVAVAQLKFRAAIGDNVSCITEVIHSSARAGADVVLFPECSVTGYNCDFAAVSPSEIGAALQAIASQARAAQSYVLVGCPTFNARKWFNSLVVFDPRGREVFRYSKIHLTARDRRFFTPGNTLAFFRLAGVACTAIICHERRYPELVRLPVMLGAQIVFHPNAGLDSLPVSKSKRRGRDGVAVRAFENEVYYVFANSVGPQGDGLWSAGDSKIVAPDSRVIALANNRDETVIRAELDLSFAGRKYARDALQRPAFLRRHWREMMAACRRQVRHGLGLTG
ncbi:MAG TPA: carbon-nitrogen hydrolase family protein [Candidatus Acidoferrum sp.]|nr:carbon-nitrogen hydrolase family protein [Candidatus Acidoferrum sp.]